MADVALKNIQKSFGENEIIKGVSLEMKDGEFLVMVGPSGCGKSTLLRLIAGLETVDSGDVLLGGQRVNDLPPKERNVAMVFQSYALYPHMTVRENMAFGLSLRKMPRDVIDARVQETAQLLELTHLLERKPKALSGGQRQRVAIGRAIVRQPRLFLFDEPLSNLDTALRVQMRGELARLHRKLKTTMVYVTHDQVEAMTLATQVAVFDKGILQQLGAPMELYERPKNRFVAGFLGSPAMNFFPVQRVAEKLRGKGFELALPATVLTRTEFLLGVRPQSLRVSSKGPFRGVVESIERMGFDGYAYLKTEDGPLVSRFDGSLEVSVGDSVYVSMAASDFHLFTPDGDAALFHPESRTAAEASS